MPQPDRRRNNIVVSDSVRASCSPEIKCLDLNVSTNKMLLRQIIEFTENLKTGLAGLEQLEWRDMPPGLRNRMGEREAKIALRRAMIAAARDLVTLWAVQNGKVPFMNTWEESRARAVGGRIAEGSKAEEIRSSMDEARHDDKGKGKQKAETDGKNINRHQALATSPFISHHDHILGNHDQHGAVNVASQPKVISRLMAYRAQRDERARQLYEAEEGKEWRDEWDRYKRIGRD